MGGVRRLSCRRVVWGVFLAGSLCGRGWTAQCVRIGSFNVESYLEAAAGTRPAKSAEAKARVRASILALQADVIALQEVAGTNALLELRGALKAEGLDYPHWELVNGFDTNIQVGVLSKLPIAARRPHSNESFLWEGRRFHVSRGFAEVDVVVNTQNSFTLIAAHLKSRRPSPAANEADLRAQEARLLRELIDRRLQAQPALDLVVLGDFNDTVDSATLRTVLGRGRAALVDTRPAERNGDPLPQLSARGHPRNVTWTHFYSKEDSYARVDYILLSPHLARAWDPAGTAVLALPNWGVASDHRPIVVSLVFE